MVSGTVALPSEVKVTVPSDTSEAASTAPDTDDMTEDRADDASEEAEDTPDWSAEEAEEIAEEMVEVTLFLTAEALLPQAGHSGRGQGATAANAVSATAGVRVLGMGGLLVGAGPGTGPPGPRALGRAARSLVWTLRRGGRRRESGRPIGGFRLGRSENGR